MEKETYQTTMNAAPTAMEINNPRAVPAQTFLRNVEEIMPISQ